MSSSEKAALRERLSAARRARSTQAIAQTRTAIRTLLLAHWSHDVPGCVAAYVPLSTEPGSTALLDGLRTLGIRVIVPVLLPDLDLDWTLWSGAALHVAGEITGEITGEMANAAPPRATLGVDAIAQADAVLVPALAVALDGTRLGRGGGSYDRALARVPAGRPIAALLFGDEVVPALPADPWDRPVTAVVTPDGWRNTPIGHHG